MVEAEAPQTEERPRNPDGTFAAKTEPEQEQAEAPADIHSEIETLRKRLADKDAFIDRQGNEIGELRKAFEERMEFLTQQVNRPAVPGSWEDLIAENPAAATKRAYELGDYETVRRAAAAWEELAPGAPELWAETVRMRREMEERFGQYEQQIQPLTQATLDQQTAQKVQAVAGKYGADTLTSFVESDAFNSLVQEFPWAQQQLAADPAGTIESLFLVHRGRHADTLNRTVEEVARDTAEQAAQATQDAYVASAATATATTAVEKTEAEQIAERFTQRAVSRSDAWRSGWERS